MTLNSKKNEFQENFFAEFYKQLCKGVDVLFNQLCHGVTVPRLDELYENLCRREGFANFDGYEKLCGEENVIHPTILKDSSAGIAEKFTKWLIELRRKLREGEINSDRNEDWSPEQEKIIASLSVELKDIFSSLDGFPYKDLVSFSPYNDSAFWSAEARTGAEEFGIALANTFLGRIINTVSLQGTIAPEAYTFGDVSDTLLMKLIWSAMSKLYAEGTRGEARIYLIDGESALSSILWNVELPILREKKEVKQIVIYTLTAEARREYDKNHGDIYARKKILQTASNWTSCFLNESNLKLKIDNKIAFRYQDLRKYAAEWRKKTQISSSLRNPNKASFFPDKRPPPTYIKDISLLVPN